MAAPQHSGPSPRGRCIMAVAAAAAAAVADFEVNVHKVSESGKNACVFGSDRDGRRVKILLYPPASVILHARLDPGGVYRLKPAPSKRGNQLSLSYSSTIPSVTSCDVAGFPSYPEPIGVEQIDDTLVETYQDIRVTVSQDFGNRDYDTKRGKVVGRGLLCEGTGDQKFELVLWGEKAATDGIKKGGTVVFYDVWVKKNTSDRPVDRMELSGSLSVFGYSEVDTLMDDVVQAYNEARSPARKRKLSELAGVVLSRGADEMVLRARLAEYAVPSADEDVGSGRGDGNVEVSAGGEDEDSSGHGEGSGDAGGGEEDARSLD